jgi:hypothetical protein
MVDAFTGFKANDVTSVLLQDAALWRILSASFVRPFICSHLKDSGTHLIKK